MPDEIVYNAVAVTFGCGSINKERTNDLRTIS